MSGGTCTVCLSPRNVVFQLAVDQTQEDDQMDDELYDDEEDEEFAEEREELEKEVVKEERGKAAV